jgi:hypothetical protein
MVHTQSLLSAMKLSVVLPTAQDEPHTVTRILLELHWV